MDFGSNLDLGRSALSLFAHHTHGPRSLAVET